MSNIKKLPPTKAHLIKVKKGVKAAKIGEDSGKRLITIDAEIFSKKSNKTPAAGIRFNICKRDVSFVSLPNSQLIDVIRKNP